MTGKKVHWNEEHPHPDEPVYNAIFAIVMRLGNNHFRAVGTGFITSLTEKGAGAISAAHVFDEIYKKQNPSEPRPRTLFTREPAQKIDLDPDLVFAFLFDGGRGHILRLSNLLYDPGSDMAYFQVQKLKPDNRKIFRHTIRVDAEMANVGDQVEGIGFKNMEFRAEMLGPSLYTVFRGYLTRRMGTVTEVLERTIKLKGPGAHVSFPIFGGMSGGPVLKLHTGKAPAAFAVLSSDYEDPVEQKNDIHTAGTTTIAKLPLQWVTGPNGEREGKIRFLSEHGTGE